jgi:MFS family permease
LEKRRIFYGWWIVLVTFIANFMSNGMSFYSWNAFLKPLCEGHHWSRTAVNLAPSLGAPLGIFAQPVFSRLVNRFGPKPLMLICALVSSASFILMGRAATLAAFYAATCVLFVSNVGINGLVPNTAVSNWFVQKRGKALGISTSGISLSGAFIPLFGFFLLDHVSLANAYLVIAALSMALIFCATALLMKNKPEDAGLFPDGLEHEAAGPDHTASTDSEGVPLGRLVRMQAFWNIGLAYGLMLMPVVGVMSQLKPRFTDIGFVGMKAMLMMSMTALIGGIGKASWGWLCDKFDPRKVVAASIFCQIAGLAILISGKSLFFLSGFIVLYGLGMGGVMSTVAIVPAIFFGRENFAKAYGYITLFLALQGLGFFMMGKSFDLFGSYDYAYFAFIAFCFIALVLILTARRPKVQELE